MTKIVRLHAFGGPENLRIDEIESRQPDFGEVLLRIEAAGINRDHYTFMSGFQFSGHGFIQPELPSRLGYEAAGIVLKVGEGVDRSWIGKRVAPFFGIDESKYGMIGEEAIIPARFLVEYPENLSPVQAAAFWVPYLTAYGALVAIAAVSEGDFVSVPAASSAVGLAAIQIAHDAGAKVIAITRTPDKKAELLALGANHVVVTGEEDYVKSVNEITGGQGVCITFDPIGGPFLEQLAQAAAPGGIIIEYGRLSDLPAPFLLIPVIGKGLTLRGYTLGEFARNPELTETAKKYLLDRLADGRFIPKIACIFAIEQVVEAYHYLMTNEQVGRVVVKISEITT